MPAEQKHKGTDCAVTLGRKWKKIEENGRKMYIETDVEERCRKYP